LTLFRKIEEVQVEQGIKRTQRDYSLAFKLSVAEQVEKGELSY
jgi:transposase